MAKDSVKDDKSAAIDMTGKICGVIIDPGCKMSCVFCVMYGQKAPGEIRKQEIGIAKDLLNYRDKVIKKSDYQELTRLNMINLQRLSGISGE